MILSKKISPLVVLGLTLFFAGCAFTPVSPENAQARQKGASVCGKMPSYTNSGKIYFCDLETGLWVPKTHIDQSREKKVFAVDVEKCTYKYKRDGYRGSPTLSCGKQLEREYAQKTNPKVNDDFGELYELRVMVIGYANCKAEILDIKGTRNPQYRGEVLRFGYKNNNFKAHTNLRSSDSFYSEPKWFVAHERTKFLVMLILPNGRKIGPVWSDWYMFGENTRSSQIVHVHAVQAFRKGTRAGEIIESGCLIN